MIECMSETNSTGPIFQFNMFLFEAKKARFIGNEIHLSI